MAKNSIRDFSATASSNTDIQSVDIDENCAASGINNAIRELMADLADVDSGTVALTSPQADNMTVTGDLTVDTSTLHVDSTNNRVGIGTASPAEQLHIIGTVRSNTSSTGDFNFYATSTGGGAYRIYPDDATTTNPTWLHQSNSSEEQAWVIGGVERMRLSAGGNVGIGTGSPTAALDVKSNNDAQIEVERTGGGGGFIGVDSSNVMNIGRTGPVDLAFKTNNTERMRIDSSGNLLVGQTSQSFSGNGLVSVLGATGAYTASIGAPSTAGTYYYVDFRTSGGTQTGAILSGNGTSTSYNTSSDYRLKENVTDITGATDRLKQLNPVRFNFIADTDTTVDGFLAHEVQDVVPEAITGTKDGMRDEEYEVTPAVLDEDGNEVTPAVMGTRSVPDYQGIDQSKLVPLLVKTIQELEARIAALESA